MYNISVKTYTSPSLILKNKKILYIFSAEILISK